MRVRESLRKFTPMRNRFLVHLWQHLPAYTIAVLIFIYAAPIWPAALPPLAMIGVIYWSLIAPDRMTILAPVCLGLLNDALLGLPLGISSLVWLAVLVCLRAFYELVEDSGFLMAWLLATIASVIFSLLEWGLYSFYFNHLYPLWPMALQAVLMALLFPAVHSFLHAVTAALYRRCWTLIQ